MAGGERSLAYALAAKHGQLWGPERLRERIALVDQMGELAHRSADTELILMHLLFRITAGLELGQIESVERDIGRYIEIAEDLKRPQSLWYTHSFRAAMALMRGHFADAEVHAQRLLSIGSRINDVNSLHSFAINAAIQLLVQGRAAEILPFANQYVERYPLIQGWRFSTAAMCFEAGHTSEARNRFELLARDAFASIPRNEQWSISACLAADLCHGLGDKRRAEYLYAELLPGAEHGCVIGFGVAYFGTIARRLGNLAATMHRWDEAEAHFLSALQREESIGARPWVAHVLYDHAAMLAERRSQADRALAVRQLARGRELAHELRMLHLSRKFDALDKLLATSS
jgi:tetratricopeptide (TPR) repeat protein